MELPTGCDSHFENPTNFKNLKEPMLLFKQTIPQKKPWYLALKMIVEIDFKRGHRRQEVKNRAAIRFNKICFWQRESVAPS